MPLKIRCPHCHRTLVAADDTAGQPRSCPACKGVFNVPLPTVAVSRPVRPADGRPTCPRCKAEVAPTATYCRRCHTDLATGRRLPWKRRLRLLSGRFWITVGVSAALLIIVAYAGVQIYRIRARPAPAPFRPIPRPQIVADELVEALFDARDGTARSVAAARLRRNPTETFGALTEAFAATLSTAAADPQARYNQLIAINLLGECPDVPPAERDRAIEVLATARTRAGLRIAALRAGALLGDAQVTDEIINTWLDQAGRLALLERLGAVAGVKDDPALRLASRTARQNLADLGDGLRRLADEPANAIYERLCGRWWDSWSWIGQDDGRFLADELFDLARPGEGTLEFDPNDVRRPRDTMKRVAETGPPAARAAAGLVLAQRGPQYRSLCGRIADTLGKFLPDVSPVDQQRLTWAIGRLVGQVFGPAPRQHPLDVTRDDIAGALHWAGADAQIARTADYPRPPQVTIRGLTPQRLLERDLVPELRAGWDQAEAARDRWLTADLGCTPALRALVDPGQRQPSYPALANAMIIISWYNEQSFRPELELWREASEQPAWVRALAYTTLASLDAQRGRWTTDWPAGIDVAGLQQLERGKPGWEEFAQVLAAGGELAWQRLAAADSATCPTVIRDRLLETARRIVDENDTP